MKSAIDYLKKIADFIIPQTCFCGEFVESDSNSLICSSCWGKLEFIKFDASCGCCGYPVESSISHLGEGNLLCASCIKKKPNFDQAISIFKYNDELSKIISNFKYYDKTNYHIFLSEVMSSAILKFKDDFDIITSIPISRQRLLKRKYNQSSILARKISDKIDVICDNRLVVRVKNIAPQVSLSRDKRLKNVRGAFAINSDKVEMIRNRSILLVDDVYTTGATVKEVSKVLKKFGAKKVAILTAGRTII